MVSYIYIRVIHKILQIEDAIRGQHENMTMEGKEGGGNDKGSTKLFFSPKFALTRDPVSVLDFHYPCLCFPTAPILDHIFFMIKHQQKISNTFGGHLIYGRIFPHQSAKHFEKQNGHSSQHFSFLFTFLLYVNILGKIFLEYIYILDKSIPKIHLRCTFIFILNLFLGGRVHFDWYTNFFWETLGTSMLLP